MAIQFPKRGKAKSFTLIEWICCFFCRVPNKKLGFYFTDGEWRYPDISDPQVAKSKFIELSHRILEISSLIK